MVSVLVYVVPFGMVCTTCQEADRSTFLSCLPYDLQDLGVLPRAKNREPKTLDRGYFELGKEPLAKNRP